MPKHEKILEREDDIVRKPSKLRKIRDNIGTFAFMTGCTGVVAGSYYFTWKITKMNLETAKNNLEAAKIAAGK